MKPALKTAITSAAAALGVTSILEGVLTPHARVVFMAHRVLPAKEICRVYNPHVALSTEEFDAFLRTLISRFDVVSLDELIASRTFRNHRLCALTLDDGWEDGYRCALPLLSSYRIPATFYVISSMIGMNTLLPEERLWRAYSTASGNGQVALFNCELGKLTPAPLDDFEKVNSAVKAIPMQTKLELLANLEGILEITPPSDRRFMDWDEILAIRAHGHSIGSHTETHAVLTVEAEDTVREELTRSRETLKKRVGEVEHLAYPNGFFSRLVTELAAKAGYRTAVTTRTGRLTGKTDLFEIPRIPVDSTVVADMTGRYSEPVFRAYLLRNL